MISNRSLNKNEKILFNENLSYGRATIKLALKAMFEEKVRYQNNGEDGFTVYDIAILEEVENEFSFLKPS